MGKKKSRGKKSKKSGKRTMNAGHGKVENVVSVKVGNKWEMVKGRYRRSDTKKMVTYSIARDAKRGSKYLPAKGKPFTGDNKKILYDPDTGKYIVLARWDKNEKKWKPVQYGGKKANAVKENKKYRKYKVGYI